MKRMIAVSLVVGVLGCGALVASLCFAMFLAYEVSLLGWVSFSECAILPPSGILLALVLVTTVFRSAYLRCLRLPCFAPCVGAASVAFAFSLIAIHSATLGHASRILTDISLLLLGFALAVLCVLWGGLWGEIFRMENKKDSYFALCLSFLLGLGIVCVGLLLPQDTTSLVLLFLACMVVAVGVYELVFRGQAIAVDGTWLELRGNDTSATMMRLRPYTAGFTTAIFISFFIHSIGFVEAIEGFAVGGCVGIGGMVVVAWAKKEIPSFSGESWAFFAMEITAIMTYVFSLNIAYAFVLGCAFSIYYVMYFLALNLTSGKNRLSPYVHFPLRIRRLFVGILLGLAASLSAIELLGMGTGFPLLIMVSLILLLLNHMRDPHYWQEWGSLYRYANDIDEGMASEELGLHALRVVRWEDTCGRLADRYDLSDREKDVFILLAKGRNSALIAEKLFISQNTARTHIYHVYSKTGLKNQQDLISLVEDEQRKRKNEGARGEE